MCLLQWMLNVVAVFVNVGLGVWALSFPGEWKALSLVFLIPASTAIALGCSPAGSRVACVASVLVIILGVGKLIFATVCAVFASEAGRRVEDNMFAGIGAVVFTILAALSGLSAISDFLIGCSAYFRYRRRSKWHDSLEVVSAEEL